MYHKQDQHSFFIGTSACKHKGATTKNREVQLLNREYQPILIFVRLNNLVSFTRHGHTFKNK